MIILLIKSNTGEIDCGIVNFNQVCSLAVLKIVFRYQTLNSVQIRLPTSVDECLNQLRQILGLYPLVPLLLVLLGQNILSVIQYFYKQLQLISIYFKKH
jgi:hypothetical protein